MAAPAHEPVRRAVVLGLFVGTGVGLGFLLAGVPNVELMTLTAALAGAALGPAGGFAAGALAEACFSLANPLGAALPVLLAGQVLGMGLAGAAGGVAAPLAAGRGRARRGVVAVVLGGGVTLLFDLLTNLATAATVRASVGVVLAAGAPFALVHVASNAVVFLLLWPALAPRARRLRRPALRAGVLAGLCAGLVAASAAHAGDAALAAADSSLVAAPLDSTAVAAADSSLVTAPPDSAAATGPLGWRRPLWEPFLPSYVQALEHRSAWLAVRDGGFGARVQLFGEPSTATSPVVLREGLPVQTGHLLVDDLAAVLQTGFSIAATSFGRDGWGGAEGVVDQVRDDPQPQAARTDLRFQAGSHDDLLRSAHLLSADAPWRLQLAIEEHLDVEGYDFRVPQETRYGEIDEGEAANFPGHASFRSGLGVVRRALEDGSSLAVSLENVRKLKSLLPALDADHQDLWRRRATLDWRRGDLRAAAWWIDADVQWDRPARSGNPPPARVLESGREGALVVAGPWRVTLERWDLRDSGADSLWAGGAGGPRRAAGEQASLAHRRRWRVGPLTASAEAAAWWDARAGWRPEAQASLAGSWWVASVARAGRAPRSDEWLTAWRYDVPGRSPLVWRPGDALEEETTWRAEVAAQRRVLGLDLAAALALRRLRDGLGWSPDSTGAASGATANGVDLDARTLRLQASHARRFLGWLRVQAQANLRDWSRDGDARLALPPHRDWRAGLMWENHFFAEDGILEVAWFVAHRGEMDDPWYLAEPVALPAFTQHDVYLGFRLVGTDLGVAFLNVTGERARATAGALTPGGELRWRLHWSFRF